MFRLLIEKHFWRILQVMKTSLLMFTLVLIALMSKGSDSKNWIAQHKSLTSDYIIGLETDDDQNAYVITGVDPVRAHSVYGNNQKLEAKLNPRGKGYTNMLITKYNTDGSILWSTPIEGKESVYAWTSHFGQDGYLYIAGNFRYDATFHSVNGDTFNLNYQLFPQYDKAFYRFFVAKYSTDGMLQWVRTGTSNDHTAVFDVKTDKLGNAYAWIYHHSNQSTVGNITLMPNADKPYYISHLYGTMVKYDAQGMEQWVFYTGDYFNPRGIWIDNENRLRIIANIEASQVYFYSTTGENAKLDYEKGRQEVREVIVNSEGKIDSIRVLFQDLKYGYVKDFEPTPDGGYLMAVESQKINGNDRYQAVVIGTDSFTHHYRESNLCLVKLDKHDKVKWVSHFGGEIRDEIGSFKQMEDGSVLACVLITQRAAVFNKDENSMVPLKTDGYKASYLLHYDDSGKLLDHHLLGNHHYNGFSGVAHLSGNLESLFISSNYSTSTPAFGVELEPLKEDSLNLLRKANDEAAVMHVDIRKQVKAELLLDFHQTLKLSDFKDFKYLVLQRLESVLDSSISAINDSIPNILAPFEKSNDAPIKWTTSNPNEVFIYPNPVSRQAQSITVRITSKSSGMARLELLNQNGALIQTQQENIDLGSVDINYEIPASLQAGLYYLKISWPGHQETQRIFVN